MNYKIETIDDKKPCSICKAILSFDNFYKTKTKKGTNILSPQCKSCHSKNAKEYRKNNPEKYTASLINKKQKYSERKELYNFRRRLKNNTLIIEDITVEKAAVLKRKYNLSVEEYLTILEKQNNCCATCNKPETAKHPNGTIMSLAVDHDHSTGKVRGLLCSKCNTALGLVKDNIETLTNLINYLKNHNDIR